MKPAIYDSAAAKELSLEKLLKLFRKLGVTRLIYKELSPNDNSKNQPYMAGHLTDLGFLPTGVIEESRSTSGKTSDPKRKVKFTASLDYMWVSPDGEVYQAPDAKLIYYPQYPEVRLSGFLMKCKFDIGGWMAPEKKGRSPGRVLFFGIQNSGKIYAYLAIPGSRIASEVRDVASVSTTGVFREIELKGRKHRGSSRDILLGELRKIHKKEWIQSKRLDNAGHTMIYKAQNGGGYTLEAELGVIPNGIAEPDFMGWEVKQFGVKRCDLIDSKVLTVMTPEPNGGYYSDKGAEAFVRKYGYKSSTTPDRYDFTGRHYFRSVCDRSGLILVTEGYDAKNNVITDAGGFIGLVDKSGNPASLWTFAKIMEHWKRKHAKAVYIPSLSRNDPDKTRCYNYCNNIRLFNGTSFNHLLRAITSSQIYYDPGINLKNASTKPVTKRRSQFRIKSSVLSNLYNAQENVDLFGS